jgi:cobalt-zinc-cadmium efflux system outer membrane protein
MKHIIRHSIAASLMACTGCAHVGTQSSETMLPPPVEPSLFSQNTPTESGEPAVGLPLPAVQTVAFVDQGTSDATATDVTLQSPEQSTLKDELARAATKSEQSTEKPPKDWTDSDAEDREKRPSEMLPNSLGDAMDDGTFQLSWNATPLTYTLLDVEKMALTNHPAIASAEAIRSKAAGLRQQVGTAPNPTLGYFGQQLADRNTDQHGIFVEQEFVRGDKLELNRQVLAHTSRAQTMESQTQRLRVLTDVRVRFYEAVAAQQSLDAINEFAKVAERGVEVATSRQEAEEGTLIETLQSQTLLSEVRLAAEQAEVTYRGAWADLSAIAGLPPDTPARLVTDLNTTTATMDWEEVYSQIIASSPELSTAHAIVCEKQALLKRQQAQPISNITGNLGAGYDNGTDSGMINVQLSAPIPVWNKNNGNISAAYADYVRATQEVKRIEQSIRSRMARTAQEYGAALASVRKYEDEIIPQATKSLELSEDAYKAGELDFLQVLIVRRSFYESTIRLIDARGNLAQAVAKVDGMLLSGGLDSPTDYTDGDGIRGASFGGQ